MTADYTGYCPKAMYGHVEWCRKHNPDWEKSCRESAEKGLNSLFSTNFIEERTMTFSEVLTRLKEEPGVKFARKGWNGKNIFIYLQPGSTIPKGCARNKALQAYDLSMEDEIKINAHVDLKNNDGSIIVGWFPTQTDMLKEDWEQA
jgi:hypothetical protein